jgi:hypothetical protein
MDDVLFSKFCELVNNQIRNQNIGEIGVFRTITEPSVVEHFMAHTMNEVCFKLLPMGVNALNKHAEPHVQKIMDKCLKMIEESEAANTLVVNDEQLQRFLIDANIESSGNTSFRLEHLNLEQLLEAARINGEVNAEIAASGRG